MYICYNQFLLDSCIFSKTGVVLISFCSLYVCVIICSSVSCCFYHIFCPAAVILESLVLMVQFSLLYNRAVRASVLYSFILVFFKVFCFLTILFIMPVIFK